MSSECVAHVYCVCMCVPRHVGFIGLPDKRGTQCTIVLYPSTQWSITLTFLFTHTLKLTQTHTKPINTK